MITFQDFWPNLAHETHCDFFLQLNPGLSFGQKFSWGLQTAFTTSALWISLVYWSVLHAYVVKWDLLAGAWMSFLNVFLHALNTVSCLVDMSVTARPVRLHHCYLPVLFGLCYTLFSAVYWAAGGVGTCACRRGREPCPCGADCRLTCDPFIYPILNWDEEAGTAVGVVLGGCLVMPLLQAFWFGLYTLRLYLHARLVRQTPRPATV